MNLIKDLKKEWKNITFNMLFAVLTLIVVIITYKNIILTTVLVGLITIIGLIKWKSKITVALFIIMGILGTFAEVYAISKGVWVYSISDFKNIPTWLFIVWGNAAAFIYQTSLEIKKLGLKK